MSSTSNPSGRDVPACSRCGATLGPDAPQGMCTRCLFGGLLQFEASAPEPPPEVWPRRFGSYELLGEVARGGMGVVYRARQTGLNRIVALKVITAGALASRESVDRFRAEARAAAGLDHPHIVPIHEIGEEEGTQYFSMRFMEGGTLSDWLARHLPGAPVGEERVRTVARMISSLARAVHHAHQRGVLHRDIKPGNVLLSAEGEPFLADFGLARLLEDDSRLTRSQAVLGSPSYMSPEQAAGRNRQLTTATDVWGLGAVLYELLTGQPPFLAATAVATMRQILEQDPRRPSALVPGLNRDLETICLKCLQREPARRYGSAEALADDLDRWLRREPIEARPVGELVRAMFWVRRRPALAGLMALTLVALVGLVISLAVGNARMRTAERTQRQLRGEAEAQEAISRHRLVGQYVAAGQRLAEERSDALALLNYLEALRLETRAPEAELHRRRIGYLLQTVPVPERFWFHDQPIGIARFDAQGQRVISADRGGLVHLWHVGTNEPTQPPIEVKAPLVDAAFLPGGSRIMAVTALGQVGFWDTARRQYLGMTPMTAARGAGTVGVDPLGRQVTTPLAGGFQRWDTANGQPIQPALKTPGRGMMADYSPDARWVAGAAFGQELMFWDRNSGEPGFSLKLDFTGEGVRFSRDGRRVAAWTPAGVQLWHMDTGQPLGGRMPGIARVQDLAFSADGHHVAVAFENSEVARWHTSAGRPAGVYYRPGTSIQRVRFGTNASQIAVAGADRLVRWWDPDSAFPPEPHWCHAGGVSVLEPSTDGSRWLTAGQDQVIRLWRAPRTMEAASEWWSGAIREAVSLEESPDGTTLFATMDGPRVYPWDTRTGRRMASFTNSGDRLQTGRLSPDGRHVVAGGGDGQVHLWDVRTRDRIWPSVRLGSRIVAVRFSPGGDLFAAASLSGEARVWRVADGTPATPVLRHRSVVSDLAFSPDGTELVTACWDGAAHRWRMPSGTPLPEPLLRHGGLGLVNRVAFSADGRWLVTATGASDGSAGAARVWDCSTGRPAGPDLVHSYSVESAEFSPDGSRVVTASRDGTARLWETGSGRPLAVAWRHGGGVSEARFSPDGRRVLTLGGDYARVWDVASGAAITPPLRHPLRLSTGTWSRDGESVWTADVHGHIRRWKLPVVGESLAALQQWIELLAAHRIDPELGAVPLSTAELRRRYEAERAAGRFPER